MKVLLIDDHPLIREGLRGILRQFDKSATILEAGSAYTGLDIAARTPDLELVLLDLHMPDMHGLEALDQFADQYIDLPVVVLSASCDRNTVNSALQRGAAGFIPKSAVSEVLVSALRLVLAGGIYVPPEVVGRGAPPPVDAPPMMITQSSRGAQQTTSTLGLTDRQSEVLGLLVQGKTNKAICRDLNLAEATVKVHVRAILRALNVATRTQAVIAANRMGIRVGV